MRAGSHSDKVTPPKRDIAERAFCSRRERVESFPLKGAAVCCGPNPMREPSRASCHIRTAVFCWFRGSGEATKKALIEKEEASETRQDRRAQRKPRSRQSNEEERDTDNSNWTISECIDQGDRAARANTERVAHRTVISLRLCAHAGSRCLGDDQWVRVSGCRYDRTVAKPRPG